MFFLKKTSKAYVLTTAYGFQTAQIIAATEGIDAVLVGDSLSMVFYGEKNTHNATLEQMTYHTRAVANGIYTEKTKKQPIIISDMPIHTYETPNQAYNSAQQFTASGAKMVKIEGGIEICKQVKFLVKHKIPVIGHIGLTPQTVSKFKVYGKDRSSAEKIMKDALALEMAGASAIVLECIPSGLAKRITDKLNIPTIGIGAGLYCDGQILVFEDLAGITEGFEPKFLKRFGNVRKDMQKALIKYIKDVRNKKFPKGIYSYK